MCVAYERSAPKYGISVEKGTDRVPDDGRYHVIVDGVIVLSTAVETLALLEMDEIKARRQAPGRELLMRERLAKDVAAFRQDTYIAKEGRDRAKGGRFIGR
jgi:hypothetical protein